MDIVLTTDANYIMPCGVMLLSLCMNNTDTDIVVHIICDNSVSEREKGELIETVKFYPRTKLKFYYIEGRKFDNFPKLDNAYLSKAAYYRLFLTDILPASIDKILYLDCDIVILHSIEELWNVDITNYALASVIDSMECYNVAWYNRLRYNPSKKYFNSGVMLINLGYWRKHNVIKKFMNYLANHPDRIVSHDQDILNVIFQDCKLLLPLTYNFQEGFLLKEQKFYYWDYAIDFCLSAQSPVILHYTVNKPWQKTCKHPMKKIFFDYCNQTIWKGFKLQSYPIKKSKKQVMKAIIIRLLEMVHLKERAKSPYINIDSIGGGNYSIHINISGALDKAGGKPATG